MEARRDSVMLVLILISLGAVMRVLPHEANFTPLAAIALFGGVYLKRQYALLVPLVALVASDVVLGFDSIESRTTVYGSFLLIGLIGMLVKKKKNFLTVILGTVGGSLLFYLITNFAYFYPETMYPHSLSGVMASYYSALPFFKATLMGDLFYVGLLFGMYEVVRSAHKVLKSRQLYRIGSKA